MSDIIYRPELDYQKNYETSGKISSNNNTTTNQEIINNKIDDLNTKLNIIQNAIKSLPSDIYNVLQVPLGGVKYMLNDIDNISPAVVQTVTQSSSTQPSSNSDSYVEPISIISTSPSGYDDQTISFDSPPDDVFSDGDMVTIDINIDNTSKADIIDQEYKYDIACIFDDYLNNIQESVANFLTVVITLASESNVTSFKDLYGYYDGNSKNVSDNMKPISDTVIRNQVLLDQRIRMYKKIFDVDSMIVNIRACKTVSELRKRYFTADYVDEQDFSTIMQNQLLADTRESFDKKYTDNLYNLYKYLNSSVILINENLNLTANSCKAKAALIKNEGVLLK